MYSANVGFSDPTIGLKKSARRGFRQRYLLPAKGYFMSIHKHLTDKSAFGPVAIEAMSKAFEEACIALQVYAGDEKGREITASIGGSSIDFRRRKTRVQRQVSGIGLSAQPVDATQALNLSAGVSNVKVLRGRSLS